MKYSSADRMLICTGDRVWVSASNFSAFGLMGTVVEIGNHVYHVDIDGNEKGLTHAYFRSEIRRVRPYKMMCKAGLIHSRDYICPDEYSNRGRCCHIYNVDGTIPTQTWNWAKNKWEDGQGL